MMTAVAPHAVVSGCPCGSLNSAIEVFHTQRGRYFRCLTCDVVFLYPRPVRESIEGYFQETYDREYGAVEASDERQPVFQSVLKHLSFYRSSPGFLLDIGCGDGAFLLLCQQAGWDCSGIELSKPAVRRAAQKGVTMLPPDVLESGDRTRPFDVVTLINVLEHVADPLSLLHQASGLLAHGGVLVVRAANGAFHLPMRIPARWVGSQYDQAFHWYLYTAKALQTFMQAAGLKVISLRNSQPSRAPLLPVHPWFSRFKWTISRTVLWPLSQTIYYATGGRMVYAPSFEMVAQRLGEA